MSIYSVEFSFSGIVTADAGLDAARRSARRRNVRAASERLVNYMLRRSEPTSEKTDFYREQVPGLSSVFTLSGPIRGWWWTGSRLFVVAGNKLREVFADYTSAERGTLTTSSGPVSIAQGLFQLIVVDGSDGYVMRLSDNAFETLATPAFYGSRRVAVLDGKAVLVKPDSQMFYWSSGVDSLEQYDPLDFASAEGLPDNIVGHLVDHREIWLFGEFSTEVWVPAPSGDSVYIRNGGAPIEVGLAACHSAQQIDNTVYWLGRDKRGQGSVWMAGGGNGYNPVRISSQELEDKLSKVPDLSGATAFCYSDAGQAFYVLKVPGLDTSWVFDASTRRWHERAEWVDGDYQPWRADSHVFAFGKQLVGDATGKVYEIDPFVDDIDGDTLMREWVSPQGQTGLTFYQSLELDITAGESYSGETPLIEMCYSSDGGQTWSAWAARSTGALGEYTKRPRWDRLGQSRAGRVWRFRTSSLAKVSIMGIDIRAERGRR